MNYNILFKVGIIFIGILGVCALMSYFYQPADSISLDPGIRYGKLPNGLTYYIKPTADGSSQKEIALLVKAGSAVLDPDQYEMQHVLEHLAFTAGKHMNMAKMRKLGLEVTASTSYYFIQYFAKSVDSQEKQEAAFKLFQDVIWDLDLKEEYIDRERSVILDEKTIRGSYESASILGALENTMLGRKVKRPDDLAKYIKTFPSAPLIRYYNEWYRPDLMALVVVGDIEDVDQLETDIKEKFSKKKNITNPRLFTNDFSHYRRLPSQFIKKEHPYLSDGSKKGTAYIRLYMGQKEDFEEDGRLALRREQTAILFRDMLRERFREELDRYALGYTVFPNFIFPSSLGLVSKINLEGGSGKKAIQKTLQVFRQLEENGFTEDEFQNGKHSFLASLSGIDTSKIQYWTGNITDHFVYDVALPADKKELLISMLKNLTRADFNEFIKMYIKTDPEEIDFIILAPSGHKAMSYSEDTIRSWIAEVKRQPVDSYEPPKVPAYLMDTIAITNLKEGPAKIQSVSIPDTKEYVLDNGIKLILNSPQLNSSKQASLNNSVSFRGFSPHGFGCYPQEDYYSALNAVDIVKNSGIGGLDKYELKRYFDVIGYSGQVVPYVDYMETGIRGTVSMKDFETSLQIVYQYFSSPNRDSMAFEDWKLHSQSSRALKSINDEDFNTEIKSRLGDYTHAPKGSKTLEGVLRTDRDHALDIYRELFSGANTFTFILSGDFPEDKVLSLCRKYLGNLSTNKVEKECKASSPTKFKLPLPISPMIPSPDFMEGTKVALVYTSKLGNDWDWKEDEKLMLLWAMMNFSMDQELRYNSKEGGPYNIRSIINPNPSRLFNEVSFVFGCNLEDADRLIKEVEQVVSTFKKGAIDKDLWEQYVEQTISNLEREKTNFGISEKLYKHYRYGKPWISVENKQAYIRSLNHKDLQEMAQRILKNKPFKFQMRLAEEL